MMGERFRKTYSCGTAYTRIYELIEHPITLESDLSANDRIDCGLCSLSHWQLRLHLQTHNLAVLIAERCAPKSQDFVDYWTHKTGKMLLHVKNSSKRSDFLRFYLYLCNAIDDFCLS